MRFRRKSRRSIRRRRSTIGRRRRRTTGIRIGYRM